jgi:hypothetical protein
MKKILLILLCLPMIGLGQCNGSLNLCSKQYNEVAYLTTHNAFNSDEDGLLFPNQTYNIISQLNDGVRGLMIDVYDHFGIPTAYHSVFALGTIPLSNIFNEINTFLDNNPNEIITIILECYVTANDIENEIIQSGLSNYLYTHNSVWPTLQSMINNNNRLVIFSDVDDASGSQDWYHYVWDYAVETHYSVNTINDFTFDFNRGNPMNDLFILNHFVTDAILGYGLYNESTDVNANPFFINRALDCQPQTNKFPNFVTVDYYESGDGLAVVDELNGVTGFGCTDSLEVTDVIIDNANLTMNIAIYNGYSSYLSMPYVTFTIDANGDTIQQGNMNLFVAWNLDTTWYNYSINSAISPSYPLTMYFVYSDGPLVTDTCILTYNSTATVITDINISVNRKLISIVDVLGRETKQTNQPLFYIYDDGAVEKRIVIE